MKKLLPVLFVMLCFQSQAQYYRYYNNFDLTVGGTPLNERFWDGIATKTNYQGGNPNYFYNVGWGDDDIAVIANLADRVRFVKQKYNGLVIQNYGIAYSDFGFPLTNCYNQTGSSIAEVTNGTGTGGFMGVGNVYDNAITGSVVTGGHDQLITKINNSGVATLSYRVDLGGSADVLNCIRQSNFPNTSFVACGSSQSSNTTGLFLSSIVVEKIAANTAVTWLRKITLGTASTPLYAEGMSVVENPSTGLIYVVGTERSSSGGGLGILIILNSAGTIQSVNEYTASSSITFNSVVLSNSNDLMVVGQMGAPNAISTTDPEALLMKINAGTQVPIFSNIYSALSGGTLSPCQANDIVQRLNTSGNEEFYFVGQSANSAGFATTIWKVDAAGNPIAHQLYDPTAPQSNAFAIDQEPNTLTKGGLSVFASTLQPITGFTYDSYSLRTYFNLGTCTNTCVAVPPPFANVTIANSVLPYNFSSTYVRTKLSAFNSNYSTLAICNQSNIGCGNNFRTEKDLFSSTNDLTVYPNPASDELTIEWNSNTEEQNFIQVYDMLGNLMLTNQTMTNIGLNQQFIELENLPSGNYLIMVSAGNTNLKKVFVKN